MVTLHEFESMPIVSARIVSQPDHFGLKNAPSNVYAIAEEQESNFEFQDAQIRLRAWPVYTETVDFDLTLVTYFAGDSSVDGGPWQPIAGEAAVASEPHIMSIWTSKTSLYADNCVENPEGAGC